MLKDKNICDSLTYDDRMIGTINIINIMPVYFGLAMCVVRPQAISPEVIGVSGHVDIALPHNSLPPSFLCVLRHVWMSVVLLSQTGFVTVPRGCLQVPCALLFVVCNMYQGLVLAVWCKLFCAVCLCIIVSWSRHGMVYLTGRSLFCVVMIMVLGTLTTLCIFTSLKVKTKNGMCRLYSITYDMCRLDIKINNQDYKYSFISPPFSFISCKLLLLIFNGR
jgi:hypothetical protein